jgi:hypothetical protein
MKVEDELLLKKFDIETLRTSSNSEESLGAYCTRRINSLLDEVGKLATVRREWWFEMNKDMQVSQPKLAQDAGVVSHTVYTEIRKYKESKQCQEIPQNI